MGYETKKGDGPMRNVRSMDLCNGPLLSKIVLYALPLALTGMLQLLYNAADIIVVGQFAGHSALAAVSATGSLINLLVNVFSGISIGVMATVARYLGAQDEEKTQESVHTSMLLSLLSGVFVAILGYFVSAPMLVWMGTPADVLEQATVYVRIYFVGVPGMMVCNFGSGILRAAGDTKRPLLYLTLSGIVNVILNLILVIVFHLGVAGVAIATSVSQYVSAVLIVGCLIREKSSVRLIPSRLRLHKQRAIEILHIGLPAGVQGSIFSISNVMIQSSVNSFGSVAMAGSGAASNLEGFAYIVMNAFYQTALTFSGQNFGARKPDRIARSLRLCLLLVFLTGALFSVLLIVFREPLLRIYSSDPEVIEMGALRICSLTPLYALCGMQEVMCGQLRGLGYSTMPMIVSVFGICGLRVIWLATVFYWYPTLEVLFFCYPVTWIVTLIGHYTCYCIVRKKVFRQLSVT